MSSKEDFHSIMEDVIKKLYKNEHTYKDRKCYDVRFPLHTNKMIYPVTSYKLNDIK